MQSHFKLRNVYFLLDKNQDEFVGNLFDVVHLNINNLEYTKRIYIDFFFSIAQSWITCPIFKQYVYRLRLNKMTSYFTSPVLHGI